ncbi:replication factor C large subunit [Halalkalirubrum salinum]|uniref:replication factor C large subunit n=1 Tax=Halalkalirubrum salinum TaxID=2563889 RepID=UPI0010FB198E|nr:replication factor C large subunit [Halalkalirubrum salinum]
MADWTETYRPQSLSELRGNDKARDALREWATSWDDHCEAAILHGSPGIGKTSAAHALAADMGWETVELNASDQRTADVIERFAGRAAQNATLAGSVASGDAGGDTSGGRQLVILDEADNIHGNYDRGGASAITRLVKSSGQPIVLIANEFYDMSRGLRNACREIEFRDVSKRSIVPVLRDICRREGIEFDTDALDRIAEANSGDLRGAVKDLQAVAEGKDRLVLEDVVTSDRDRSMDLFPFLDAVLKEQSAEAALQSAYAVDETPDDLTAWIEHNLLSVYTAREAISAYDALSNADRWLGRVRASQNYSYWRYATDNLAAGVAAARDEPKGGWTRYRRPQFWGSSDSTREELCQQIAERSGVSMAIARREILPYLSAMTHHCKPRELTVAMAAAYDLDEEGVAFVTGSGKTTKKVASIVKDAQAIREAVMTEHTADAFAPRADEPDTTDDAATTGPEAIGPNGAGEDAGHTNEDEAESADDDPGDDENTATDDGQAGLSDFI